MNKIITFLRQCFGNPVNRNKISSKYERKSFNEKDLKNFNQDTRLYNQQYCDNLKKDWHNSSIMSGMYVFNPPITGYYICSGLMEKENKSNSD